jgi:hypothetical protein
MASQYMVGIGLDLALVDLDLIVPQPSSGGIRPTQRTYGTSGQVHEQGLYAELVWNTIYDAADYQTLLAQFGLTSALTGLVTVYIRNSAFSYARYNAKAVRPQNGDDMQWNNYFLRGVTILLKNLEAI